MNLLKVPANGLGGVPAIGLRRPARLRDRGETTRWRWPKSGGEEQSGLLVQAAFHFVSGREHDLRGAVEPRPPASAAAARPPRRRTPAPARSASAAGSRRRGRSTHARAPRSSTPDSIAPSRIARPSTAASCARSADKQPAVAPHLLRRGHRLVAVEQRQPEEHPLGVVDAGDVGARHRLEAELGPVVGMRAPAARRAAGRRPASAGRSVRRPVRVERLQPGVQRLPEPGLRAAAASMCRQASISGSSIRIASGICRKSSPSRSP